MSTKDIVKKEAKKCADAAYDADPEGVQVADPMEGDWRQFSKIFDGEPSDELEDIFRETYRGRLAERIEEDE